ncbi:hypothetical protein R3X27_15505 [Tropicimonas sp. TH_r6]|uniref:hypothetical protein n=1 Tax=Tropicimonas sp. TH_r6 TaxID=3082085 RepID=UPI002952BFC7|nr:hypothetical protein [Tropicimonas sp. TH_r6]MDV7144093.1 hypothetical protein [Tropicimonas sp. TH_r6]
MQLPDAVEWQRRSLLNASLAVEVDPAEGISHVDTGLAGREVDDGSNRAEDPCGAASCKLAVNEIIAEGIGISLGIRGDVLVATDVDDIATGALSCPMERDGTSIPLEAQVDRDSLRKRELLLNSRCLRDRYAHRRQVRTSQTMLAGEIYILNAKVIPVLVKL